MIGLTSRLNERDDTIIQMQHEVDQYDHRVKDLGVAYQRSKERVNALELILIKKKIEVPRDYNYSLSSPGLRKTQVSPHEIYIPNNENYVAEIALDQNQNSDSEEKASANFEDYQLEFGNNVSSSPPRVAQSSTKKIKDMENVVVLQKQQLKEKDELLEKLKEQSIPASFNKKDVKEAMQNIVAIEVEQRTR